MVSLQTSRIFTKNLARKCKDTALTGVLNLDIILCLDQLDCDFSLYSESGNNYVHAVQGAENITRVKFSVVATNDVHISLSPNSNVAGSDIEIVLGGWAGTRSVIRFFHQGTPLVQNNHTIADFNKV